MNIEQIRSFRKSIRIFERILESDIVKTETSSGLGLHHLHVLVEINEQKETSLKNLESLLGTDKSTLSKTVDVLVKLGLVNRIVSPTDRRFICCSLTPSAKEIVDGINAYCDTQYLKVFSLIAENEHNTILTSLEKLAIAMDTVFTHPQTVTEVQQNTND